MVRQKVRRSKRKVRRAKGRAREAPGESVILKMSRPAIATIASEHLDSLAGGWSNNACTQENADENVRLS